MAGDGYSVEDLAKVIATCQRNIDTLQAGIDREQASIDHFTVVKNDLEARAASEDLIKSLNDEAMKSTHRELAGDGVPL